MVRIKASSGEFMQHTYRRSVYQNDIYLFSPDLLDAGRLQKTHGMVVATVGFRM